VKRSILLVLVMLFVSVTGSCATPTSVPPAAATSPLPPTATMPATAEAANLEITQEPVPFPLSELGPYWTGKRTFTFEDASRDGRQIGITVFYPAVLPEGSKGPQLLAGTNRDPDLSSAPYPLIITGPDSANYWFKTHLVSHGFVMAVVRYPGPIVDNLDLWVIDHPRDILFVLDQIASCPPAGLEGIIDTGRVGVAGYSAESVDAFAVSGVRVDPEFYLLRCKEAPAMEPALPEMWELYVEITCNLAQMWDEFAARAGDSITFDDDGLWQPLTDERIRAVMATGPAWLYGERGLAAVDRPILIVCATEDEVVPYRIEPAYVFEHLGTPERFLISFVGQGHMMVFDPEQVKRMNHFAAAFFGTYLQGKSEYRNYFSEAFVSQFDDLAWGVYEGE